MNLRVVVAAHKPYWMPADPVYLRDLLARTHPPEEITLVLAPGQTPPAQPWPFPLDAVV